MPDLVLSTPGSYKFWPFLNSDLTPSNKEYHASHGRLGRGDLKSLSRLMLRQYILCLPFLTTDNKNRGRFK